MKKLVTLMFMLGALAGCQGPNAADEVVLTTLNAEYHEIIEEAFIHFTDYEDQRPFKIGVTSHHLPVAVQLVADFWHHLIETGSQAPTFVVIGPDHTEKCLSSVTSGNITYQTSFGKVETDQVILADLASAGLDTSGYCLETEHSLGVQADYIAYLFPESKILPIAFSATTPQSSLIKVADVLEKHAEQITVITSVDFNHYRSADQADEYDAQTRLMIEDLDADLASIDNVDSPPSLQLAFILAERFGYDEAVILEELNSYVVTGSFENTTGYFNVSFVEPS